MNKTQFIKKLVSLGIKKEDITAKTHSGYGITAEIKGELAKHLFDYQTAKPRQMYNVTFCYYDGEKIIISASEYEIAYEHFVIDIDKEIAETIIEIEKLEKKLEKQKHIKKEIYKEINNND